MSTMKLTQIKKNFSNCINANAESDQLSQLKLGFIAFKSMTANKFGTTKYLFYIGLQSGSTTDIYANTFSALT